ncbi:MAG: hypothetical protein ACREJO_07890 [Phycisphaerales bacterium]
MSSDPYGILFKHNRWAMTVLAGAARNLTKPDFHRRYGYGLGSFHDAMVSAVGLMQGGCDRIECSRPRRSLVQTDAHGNVVASTTHTPHGLMSMVIATCDEMDSVLGRSKSRLGETLEWSSPRGESFRCTVEEMLLYLATALTEQRAVARDILNNWLCIENPVSIEFLRPVQDGPLAGS